MPSFVTMPFAWPRKGERSASAPLAARCTSSPGKGVQSSLSSPPCCCRQAMPPVSVLPKTSIGSCAKRCRKAWAAAAGSGPPEENTARSCGPSDPGGSNSGKRVSCAGLEDEDGRVENGQTLCQRIGVGRRSPHRKRGRSKAARTGGTAVRRCADAARWRASRRRRSSRPRAHRGPRPRLRTAPGSCVPRLASPLLPEVHNSMIARRGSKAPAIFPGRLAPSMTPSAQRASKVSASADSVPGCAFGGMTTCLPA